MTSVDGRELTLLTHDQPAGEDGIRFSLMTVAQKIAKGRMHPDVRAWTLRKLAEAGNPKGAKARCEVLLEALRRQSGWVPDPTDAEMIPDAYLMLGDGAKPAYFALGDCFAQGTLMLGEGHNLIPVEELRAGMKIWGLDRWSTVERVAFKGPLKIDVVRLNNGSDLKLTPDHHVYVLDCTEHAMLDDDATEPKALPADRHWRGKSETWGCACSKESRIEKRTRVSELRQGMVLPTPERIPFGGDAMDLDRAYVEGLYVSDGWAEQNRFGISGQDGCPKEEQKRAVKEICDRLGIETRWHRKYISVKDADWTLRMHQMGTHAPQKHLLSINLDEGTAASTLRGVMADSGKNTRGDQRTFTTTSRLLAVQTRLLHKMFGITCGWSYIEDHGGLGSNAIYRLGTRGNTRADGRQPWLLRVRKIEREMATVPCWDITTDDHRVYLAEHDVTVSQCDDLTTAYGAAVLAALMMLSSAESVGARCAVVGHAYKPNGSIEHVLGAVYDQGRWWYAEPSIPGLPLGECRPFSREYVIEVPSLQVLCDAPVCLAPDKGIASGPPPAPRRGDFLSVGNPGEAIVVMDSRSLRDVCDLTGICQATVTTATPIPADQVASMVENLARFWTVANAQKGNTPPAIQSLPYLPGELDWVTQHELYDPWGDGGGGEPRSGADMIIPRSGAVPAGGC